MTNKERVFVLVSKIPQGRVMTYGQVGAMLQIGPRVVGNILHQNTDPKNVPCHRVVNSRGECAKNYAFGGEGAQQKMLEKEGIRFTKNRLDLGRYRWQPAIGIK